MSETMTTAERAQLRQLLNVYDHPSWTATWRGKECDRLVELGYAQRHEYADIKIVSLRPDRVEDARAVLAGDHDQGAQNDERQH